MVTILKHPIAGDHIAALRDKATQPDAFRRHLDALATLLAVEALRDIRTKEVQVETPLAMAKCDIVDEPGLIITPILRAGVGMLNAVLNVIPYAQVGMVGIKRNEETAEPIAYYENVPQALKGDELAVVIDPMLATGGSVCSAIARLKNLGYRRIKFLCIVASPQGLDKVQSDHPDVQIYTAVRDEGLNSKCYILPGLGDAGDRIFGTLP